MKSNFEFIKYDKENVEDRLTDDFQDIIKLIDSSKNYWINIHGLHQPNFLDQLGIVFEIHPLTLEDILNFNHLPKIEDHDSYLYFTMRHLKYIEGHDQIVSEQFSFVLAQNFVISFMQNPSGIFDPVKQKILTNTGKTRGKKTDYLFYQLLDVLVDSYFPFLEKIRERIEDLEDEMIEKPYKNYINQIHFLKKQHSNIRKLIYPLFEATNKLTNSDTLLIDDDNNIYFNDVFDHMKHLISILDSIREMLANLMEINMANMNNKMNNIMKTLTVVSTIFIPMTFVAGVYGMNFQIMPELTWSWGYYYSIGLMFSIGIGIVLYMKFKRWF